MEDYIFLIIAIALSIFGAINQNKKKKNEGNPVSENEEGPHSFFMDQFLEDDFPEEKEEVVSYIRKQPVVRKEPVVVAPEAWQSTLRQSTFKSTLPERSKNSLRSLVKSPVVEELAEEQEAEQGTGYLDDFSLRKAFVYSEILTRKY